MSQTSSAMLANAFFDAPGLLAVRFRGHAAEADTVTGWAIRRHPDPGGIRWISAAPVAVCGLVFGMLMLPHCSDAQPPVHLTAAQETDATEDRGWPGHLLQLADDLGPTRPALMPYVVRTLLDVPRELESRGDRTGGWLKPGLAPAERTANQRAARLLGEPDIAEAGTEVALIIDLPGAQTIAAGAALARHCEPVPTFDNLPHPQGVVPSFDTLAAAVAWARSYRLARHQRRGEAPPMFLLEGERLLPYDGQADRFDNRSHARLPDVAGWQALGVKRIIYVREHAGDIAERDDLNELFVALADAGIAIRHVGLDRFDPSTAPPASPASAGHYSTIWHAPWGGRPHPDDDYRSPRRSLPPTTGMFDGGRSRHDWAIGGLMRPIDRSSSGGSWGRVSSSSSG